MDRHDAWAILAEQGVLFRPAPAHTASWEYSIPTLTATWYGPYLSREEALRAALRQLLSLAQAGTSLLGAEKTTHIASEQPSGDLAAQLKLRRQQLRQLELVDAKLGIADAPELKLRIAQLREQVIRIEEQMAQSGEE